MNAWNLTGQFQPGRLVYSSRIAGGLTVSELATALARHLSGDWGDISQPLREGNDRFVKEGRGPIFSMYRDEHGQLFSVATVQAKGEEETAVYYLDEWTDYQAYRVNCNARS